MVYEGVLEGRYVDLRSVIEDDAKFTLSLRQDPLLTQYLPQLDITEEQQREWICNQRILEGDYFFVISNKLGKQIGVISLYDIKEDTCENGRIAVIGDAFQSIEAQLLNLDFAFNILGLSKVIYNVYAENIHAVRFAKLFGSEYSGSHIDKEGKERIDGVFTKESYAKSREKISKILYRK